MAAELQLYLFEVTNDQPVQVYHPYTLWECFDAGFFASAKTGWSDEQCEAEYYRILSNCDLFSELLERVLKEWPYSCEHFLTNESMNRIAWLGQAAVCMASGIPSRYCYAWGKLSSQEQEAADNIALTHLNRWLGATGRTLVAK